MAIWAKTSIAALALAAAIAVQRGIAQEADAAPEPLPDPEMAAPEEPSELELDLPEGPDELLEHEPMEPTPADAITDEPADLEHEHYEGEPGWDSWVGEEGPPAIAPWWFADMRLLVLNRNRPKELVVSTARTSGTRFGTGNTGAQRLSVGANLLSFHSFEFDTEAGPLVTLGGWLGIDAQGRDHFLSATYFTVSDWDAAAIALAQPIETPPDQLFVFEEEILINSLFGDTDFGLLYRQENVFDALGNQIDTFGIADRHVETYSSNLNSLELTWRMTRIAKRGGRLVLLPGGPWHREYPLKDFSYGLLAGVRYLRIHEAFSFSALAFDANNVLQPVASFADRTRNNLIGLQGGAELVREWTDWSVGVRGKGGVYVNFAEMITQHAGVTATGAGTGTNRFPTEADLPSFAPIATFSDSSESFAASGEIAITGVYRLFPGVTLRGEYDFLWVRSLALAPDQIQQPFAQRPINDEGHTFFHGGAVGLEFVW